MALYGHTVWYIFRYIKLFRNIKVSLTIQYDIMTHMVFQIYKMNHGDETEYPTPT